MDNLEAMIGLRSEISALQHEVKQLQAELDAKKELKEQVIEFAYKYNLPTLMELAERF